MPAGVAVLDKEADVAEADVGDEQTDAESPPRRHSTPEPGTAAERAAARRARLRGESDGKEER